MSGYPCNINKEIEAQRGSDLAKVKAEILLPKLTVFPPSMWLVHCGGGYDLFHQMDETAVGFTFSRLPQKGLHLR